MSNHGRTQAEVGDILVAVIIPAYRVKNHVLQVITGIPPLVGRIYVVDDACPDGSGRFVIEHNVDPRVSVIHNSINLGVGGAVMAGYRAALADGAEIAVKLDGDGQMDASLIPRFIAPLLGKTADYTKGNRFYDLRVLQKMPRVRLFGNAVLSFMAKLSTGYWNLFDPTNGYTAISRRALSALPLERISNRYFFETDILFRLNSVRAVVRDVSMEAVYADEQSNLKISKVIPEFLLAHTVNFGKRIFYNYFLRDFSVASVELVLGILMFAFGAGFGAIQWAESIASGVPSTAGSVMISAVSLIFGLQLLLAFLSYDITSTPKIPLNDS
jgi:glycosyltransferase involved in cell wall biosynthesis